MKWYIKVLKNYFNFTGRARRTELWMFVLFNTLFWNAASLLDKLLGTTFPTTGSIHYGWFYTIYCIAILLPSLAVSVRRLHDIGKSGGWLLICFIPIIGGIILLVWDCTEGQEGENQYGPDPKQEEEQQADTMYVDLPGLTFSGKRCILMLVNIN